MLDLDGNRGRGARSGRRAKVSPEPRAGPGGVDAGERGGARRASSRETPSGAREPRLREDATTRALGIRHGSSEVFIASRWRAPPSSSPGRFVGASDARDSWNHDSMESRLDGITTRWNHDSSNVYAGKKRVARPPGARTLDRATRWRRRRDSPPARPRAAARSTPSRGAPSLPRRRFAAVRGRARSAASAAFPPTMDERGDARARAPTRPTPSPG